MEWLAVRQALQDGVEIARVADVAQPADGGCVEAGPRRRYTTIIVVLLLVVVVLLLLLLLLLLL